MKIDAHQHFWTYSAEEFGWIGEEMAEIRRDFLPPDLAPELHAAGLDGCISVQARMSWEETEWLLRLGRAHSFIKGIVGWVPLTSADLPDCLDRLAAEPLMRGCRHVCQGEAPGFLLRSEFNRGIAQLGDCGLTYDILIYEDQLSEAIQFVDLHPDQVFILDHGAKPRIREGILEPWRTNLRELARRENVYCKISGLITEADHLRWSEAELAPYFDSLLESFGPARLMFGSDWPVCRVASPYTRWSSAVRKWTDGLSAEEGAAIWGGTALLAYGIAK